MNFFCATSAFNLAVFLLIAFVLIRDLKCIKRKAVSIGLCLGFNILALGLNKYHEVTLTRSNFDTK